MSDIKMVRCKQCGFEVDSSSKFCLYCGAELTNEGSIPKVKKPMEENVGSVSEIDDFVFGDEESELESGHAVSGRHSSSHGHERSSHHNKESDYKKNDPIYKKWWFWVILLAVLALIVGLVFFLTRDKDSTPSDSASPGSSTSVSSSSEGSGSDKGYETTDLSEMFDQLEINALNAKKEYKDKEISVTGVVTVIDSDGAFIRIEPEDANNYDIASLRADTLGNDDVVKQVSEIEIDDVVTVRGTITNVGEHIGYEMSIDELEKVGTSSSSSSKSSGNSSTNSQKSGNSQTSGNSQSSGSSQTSGNSQSSGSSQTSGNNQKSGNSQTSGNSQSSGSSQTSGSSSQTGNTNATTGERSALSRATSYLGTGSWSFNSLYYQLVAEGFSEDEAGYAVRNCGADWNEQALKKARSYLETGNYSYTDLYNQLIADGQFTEAQADYAARICVPQ